MTAEVPEVDVRLDPEADLTGVAGHFRAGGMIAYPTETVYGLGGACTPDAVHRVRGLKGRSEGKPLLILIRHPVDVEGLTWSDAARELASIFWPGSLTLVLHDPAGRFPPGVRSHRGTVAVRVSSHPLVGCLLEAFGAPLTSTSLNLPDEPPAASGDEAREVLKRLDARDTVLLNAGTLPPSDPSTVVDCTRDPPIVLRAGAVPTGRLRCALPEIHERPHR